MLIDLNNFPIFKCLFRQHAIKIKFVLVGIWNTVFGYFIYIFLNYVISKLFKSIYSYLPAMVLANIISIINAYFSHKKITFKSRIRGNKQILEFIRFSMTYVFSIIFSTIFLTIFVEVFDLDPNLSGAFTIAITVMISYVGHLKYSFREKKQS